VQFVAIIPIALYQSTKTIGYYFSENIIFSKYAIYEECRIIMNLISVWKHRGLRRISQILDLEKMHLEK
jgi:hypothetical protein